MDKKSIDIKSLLTGNYIAESIKGTPNVEIEKNEFVKNSQDGSVKKAVGDKHIDGGIKVNLPDGSKVLSSYTKIGAANVKIFEEMFDIKVKASDTFATVLDRYSSKIGVKKLEKEETELLDKLEKNHKSSIDRTTKKINEDFLAQEIAEVNKKKEALNKLKAEAFEAIFKEQEKIPKKGDGTQVLDKNGNPIKQQGGMVDERVMALAKQYNMQPEEVMQILQEGAEKKKQQYGSSYQEGGMPCYECGGTVRQEGGQQISPEQIIQAYAEAVGQDPNQVMQQLQQLPPEQQQAALQQMIATLQGEGQPQMQEGGQMEQMAQAVMQQLQEGASPDEVITQLIQQGVPHEQAMQLVQGIMQQAAPQEGQPQMRYGGMYNELPKHQEGTANVPNLRDPYWNFRTQVQPRTGGDYTYTGSSILNQPILSGVELMQPQREGLGYGKDVQDVEKTITTHPWYFNTEEKKKSFREAIKKGGAQPEVGAFQRGYNEELTRKAKEAGYSDAEIAELIASTGFTGQGVQQFDEKFGAFTSTRPTLDFTKSPITPASPTYTGDMETPLQTRRDVVKNVIYDKGMPYIMPPSAPIAPYLQQVNLSRLEAQKGSVENQLQASENARQAAMAATRGLPPAQAAAVMANYLATSGQQDVQGIAAQEMQDLQNKARIEQYNASQSDKEQILNEQLKKRYEAEAFGTLNRAERDWRQYFNQQDLNRQALSDEIERRNILNAQLENYQLTGTGGFEFVNRSPFQYQLATDPRLKAFYDSMTPEQKLAYEKAYAAKYRQA